jgi:hypothetical protein
MTHPDSYLVGMLSLGMVAVGVPTVVVLILILGLNSYRFLPLRRSRSTFWLGLVVLAPLTVPAVPLSAEAVKALAVIASFGWDAYESGLHVVNKRGQLSDGRYLGVFWAAAMGGMTVTLAALWIMPLVVWCLHFSMGRGWCPYGATPSGVVRLRGEPLRRARVTFHLVAGARRRAYLAVKTDEAGRYEAYGLPPRSFRVTVSSRTAAVPPGYTDADRTPLCFDGEQLGPLSQDFDLAEGPRYGVNAAVTGR